MKQILVIIMFFSILSCSNDNTDKTSDQRSDTSDVSVVPGLMKNMEQKDTMRVNYETTGCQAHIKQQLLFYYQGNKIFASIKTEIPDIDNEFPVIKTELSDSALKYYEIFENELRKSAIDTAPAPCPTITEKYSLCIKKDTVKLIKACSLNNKYRQLKNAIFGKNEIQNLEEKIYR